MLVLAAVNKKREHGLENVFTVLSESSRLCKRSRLSASWSSLAARAGAAEPRTHPPARGSAGNPKTPAGGGKGWNSGGQRKAAARGKQCAPSRKRRGSRTRRRLQAALPAAGPRGAGGGAEPPSLAGWERLRRRGPGVTAGRPRVRGETGIRLRGRREEEGICSSWEGGPRQKGRKRRNRLMLCRTPRVFLSGVITSTFRQEQELGGKQQPGLTARR